MEMAETPPRVETVTALWVTAHGRAHSSCDEPSSPAFRTARGSALDIHTDVFPKGEKTGFSF